MFLVISSVAEKSLLHENLSVFCFHHGKRERNAFCWDDEQLKAGAGQSPEPAQADIEDF